MSEIPKYPRHLTKEERSAVYSQAVRDRMEGMSASEERAQATKGELCQFMAAAIVSTAWTTERLRALEEAVAELRAANTAKPRVRVPAGSDK